MVVGTAPTAAVKGYLRGFDVRTGQRKWIFHTIPQKGEFGYDTWITPGQAEAAGNVGVWAPMSADEELGLVYAGVELPPTDLNGTERHGNALFSESVVALDIETGVRKWHYQLTHHGLWDYDIPCAVDPVRPQQCTAARSRRWPSPASRASSMCWTATPASRSGRSRKPASPGAMCRANGIRRPSRSRRVRRR